MQRLKRGAVSSAEVGARRRRRRRAIVGPAGQIKGDDADTRRVNHIETDKSSERRVENRVAAGSVASVNRRCRFVTAV